MLFRLNFKELSCLLMFGSLGCGPSQDVLDQQEAQLQKMIEEAKTDPPNMSPAEREMRRHRLEMDFGETPSPPNDAK